MSCLDTRLMDDLIMILIDNVYHCMWYWSSLACRNLYNCLIYYLGVSFLSYLKGEVTRGYLLQENEEMYSEKQKRVLTFMRTPRELEKVEITSIESLEVNNIN